MKSKLWLWIGLNVLLLHGCASTPKNHADSMQLFASPQDLIDQKQLNGSTGISREYIYDWGQQQPNIEPESLYPRKYLSQYCHANGGKFSVLRHSNLSLIKDHSTKKILASHPNVKQGIGAYQCDYGTEKSWIVSIEPTAQRKNLDQNATSVVSLQTRIMTLEETKTFYSKANPVSAISPKKGISNPSSTKNMKHQLSLIHI